jgi:hypothetical protein
MVGRFQFPKDSTKGKNRGKIVLRSPVLSDIEYNGFYKGKNRGKIGLRSPVLSDKEYWIAPEAFVSLISREEYQETSPKLPSHFSGNYDLFTMF